MDLVKSCTARIKMLLSESKGAIGTAIHEDVEELTESKFNSAELIKNVKEIDNGFDPKRYFESFKIIFDNTPPKENNYPQRLTSAKEPIVRAELDKIDTYLEEDQKKIIPVIESKRNLTVDCPTPFEMIDLLNMIEEEIKAQSVIDNRIRSNMAHYNENRENA